MSQEPLLDEDDGDEEEESLELQEVIIDKQPQVMLDKIEASVEIVDDCCWTAQKGFYYKWRPEASF